MQPTRQSRNDPNTQPLSNSWMVKTQNFYPNEFDHLKASVLSPNRKSVETVQRGTKPDRFIELAKSVGRTLTKNPGSASTWQIQLKNIAERNRQDKEKAEWENVKPLIYREYSHPSVEKSVNSPKAKAEKIETPDASNRRNN